jgi:hypothetical protein
MFEKGSDEKAEVGAGEARVAAFFIGIGRRLGGAYLGIEVS